MATTTTSTTRDLTGSMTQVFRIATPDNVPGLYLTGIDLYFQAKSGSFGAELSLLAVTNGQPDPSQVIVGSTVTLAPEDISTSADASVPTRFQFPQPVYVDSGQRYAFSIRALGNSPDYSIWAALNGAKDISSGISVSSNPLSEDAYYAKTSSTWAEIANEDLKYTIYRAQFNVGSTSQAMLKKSRNEMFGLTNLSLASGLPDIRAGDECYGLTNGCIDTTKYAKVTSYDSVNNYLYLRNSTGNFAEDDAVAVCRTAVEGQVTSTDGMLAVARILEIFDMPLHAIVPKIGLDLSALTTASIQYRGVYKEGDPLIPVKESGDNDWINLSKDQETDFYDKPRYVLSRSNEVAGISGNSSVDLRISMTSNNDYLSPVIDLKSNSIIAIQNLIGDDIDGEEGDYGQADTRYISKIVTLADGQESEDLKVYISAYKPAGTIIKAYVKLWNEEDSDDFDEKPWTEMPQTTDPSSYSATNNLEDYKEYEFDLPTAFSGIAGTAWCPQIVDPIDGDPVQYVTDNGTFIGFKKFSIKLVLAVNDPNRAFIYPRINDCRALALQK